MKKLLLSSTLLGCSALPATACLTCDRALREAIFDSTF